MRKPSEIRHCRLQSKVRGAVILERLHMKMHQHDDNSVPVSEDDMRWAEREAMAWPWDEDSDFITFSARMYLRAIKWAHSVEVRNGKTGE